MKKFFAVTLTLCIFVSCLLCGCAGVYSEGDWEQIYSTIDNPIYNDDLDYKFTLYTREDMLLFFKCMQYRIVIYKSDNLDVPYKTYTSDWLNGVSGVELKHTIVKDPGMNDLYGMYLMVLAADNSIKIVNDMKQEALENGYEATIHAHLDSLTDVAVGTLSESCGAYAENMVQDIYNATLFSLSGAYLDSTTQFVDDITSALFGQSDNANLFTTKTVGFLDDLGVYVDAEDIDLTFGMADAVMMFPQKFNQLVHLAFASEGSLANASLTGLQAQCTESRREFIEFVLAHCDQ